MHLSPYSEQKGIVTSCSLTACLNLGLHSNEKNTWVSVILESKGLIHRACGALFINDLCLCIKGSGVVCVAQRTIDCLSWVIYTRSIFIKASQELCHNSLRAKYFIYSSFTHGREHDRLKCLCKSYLKWFSLGSCCCR